jgi:hypothetical protein
VPPPLGQIRLEFGAKTPIQAVKRGFKDKYHVGVNVPTVLPVGDFNVFDEAGDPEFILQPLAGVACKYLTE